MSKIKTPHKPTPEPIDWAEQIQQHPAFEWALERRQYIPYLFISLLALIIIGYKLTSGNVAKAESSYQMAEGYWTQIQRNIGEKSDLTKQEDALTQLQTITNNYPELHSKYDGMIAQLLLVHGETDAAIPYIKRTEARTEEDQNPLYKQFSQSTLLIAQGQHEEALEASLTLREKLLKQTKTHLLLPYTLIRIAMLYQGMGEKDLEILAWDDWKQFIEGKSLQKPDTKTLEIFSGLFSEGSFTLERYIKARSKSHQMQ